MYFLSYLSLTNVDYDWLGRCFVIFIIFAFTTCICFIISAGIKKAIRTYKNHKTREYLSHKDLMKKVTVQDLMRLRKMEVPEEKKNEFFFGGVSDWSKMK